MANFDEKYPNARTEQGKPGWPNRVRSISMGGLNYLGVDDEGNLYWDGRPIKLRQPLELSTAQGIGAWILIVSAVSVAFFDALRFFGIGAQ